MTDPAIPEGSFAAAAMIAPDIATLKHSRLSYRLSPAAAELVGLELAPDIICESPTITSVAIFCDPRHSRVLVEGYRRPKATS